LKTRPKWNGHTPVLCSLSISDHKLILLPQNILHPQFDGLGDPPILRDGLPTEGSEDWRTADRKLAVQFVRSVGGSLNPPVIATALRIAHPHNEAKVDALRAVYNGDVPEPDGGCLPRVWRWEHEDQVFWLVELPPHMEYAWRSLT
jgi:hypothetical protein